MHVKHTHIWLHVLTYTFMVGEKLQSVSFFVASAVAVPLIVCTLFLSREYENVRNEKNKKILELCLRTVANFRVNYTYTQCPIQRQDKKRKHVSIAEEEV